MKILLILISDIIFLYSVAGALTFFPPDPPLYTFIRTLDGKQLPDEYEDENDHAASNGEESDEQQRVADSDSSENEALNVSSDGDNEKAKKMKSQQSSMGLTDSPRLSDHEHDREDRREVHPAQALTDKALLMRKIAKKKNRRDALDAQKGVTYEFVPDPRLSTPPGYSGTIEAVKVPYKIVNRSGVLGGTTKLENRVHVAATIYRIREDRVTDATKTIIYSHGNATDIGAMYFMQVIIAKGLKCNVVMYDYSGYGESGGVSLEENTYRDIETVYDYVLENVVKDKNEKNIILYGQSVGGGPSCYLAAQKKNLGGLILHSAFMSGMRVLTPSRALGCLDIFPNINHIKKVNCPVMVIHGMLDEEVTFNHGTSLQEAVPDKFKRSPWYVKDRGHNDITDGRTKILEYIQRLKAYVESLEVTDSTTPDE